MIINKVNITRFAILVPLILLFFLGYIKISVWITNNNALDKKLTNLEKTVDFSQTMIFKQSIERPHSFTWKEKNALFERVEKKKEKLAFQSLETVISYSIENIHSFREELDRYAKIGKQIYPNEEKWQSYSIISKLSRGYRASLEEQQILINSLEKKEINLRILEIAFCSGPHSSYNGPNFLKPYEIEMRNNVGPGYGCLFPGDGIYERLVLKNNNKFPSSTN